MKTYDEYLKEKAYIKKLCKILGGSYIQNYYDINGYCFTATEAAWIIHRAEALTLQEKFDYWNELMEIYKDEKLRPGAAVYGYTTLFEFLRCYMTELNQAIKELYTPSFDSVYSAAKLDKNGKALGKTGPFSTLDKAVDEIIKRDFIPFNQIEVRKEVIDNPRKLITARFNEENVLLWIYHSGKTVELNQPFCHMWFDLPSPYKKGDLIWIPGLKRESLIVVKGKPELTEQEKLDWINTGEENDICLEGWPVYPASKCEEETTWCHLDYELYTEELTQEEKERVEEIRKKNCVP